MSVRQEGLGPPAQFGGQALRDHKLDEGVVLDVVEEPFDVYCQEGRYELGFACLLDVMD